MAGGAVGRETELAALAAAIDAAQRGRGSVVHVVGEPGIGKTTLCDAAADLARRAGFEVAQGRAVEEAPAFWPWRAVVRRWPELDGGVDRFELFEEVAHELADRASATGLLVVLDDLHWADESSLRLVEHVARSVPDHPLLLVVTSRSHEAQHGAPLEAVAATLARLGAVLHLEGLDVAAVGELAVSIVGRALTDAATRAVVERTNGNPFFAEQVLRLVSRDDLDPSLLDVPAGVGAVVRQRVAGLGDEAVEVLGAASVLGRTFGLPALRAVLGGLDPVKATEAAVGAGLVAVDGGRSDRFRFVHAIVRDALHAHLPPDRRATLHGRAYWHHHGSGATPPAVLAAHAEAAAALLGIRPAITHSIAAAADALHAQAFEEALRLVARTLELEPDDGARRQLLMIAGTARFHLDEYEASLACFVEAADLAGAVGDVDGMAEALLAAGTGRLVGHPYDTLAPRFRRALDLVGSSNPARRAELQGRLADLVPDVRERRSLLDDAVADARSAGDDRVLGTALGRLLLHGCSWMSMAERSATVEEMRAASRRAGSPDLHLDAEAIAVRVLVEAGDLDAALRTASALAADPLARVGSLELRAAPIVEVLVDVARGRLDDAEARLAALMDAFEQRGRAAAGSTALGGQQLALQLELGNGAKLVPMLQALRATPEMSAYVVVLDGMVAIALAYAGDAAGSCAAIDLALGTDLEAAAADWAGNGLAACGLLAEAAWLSDHRDAARRLDRLLAPAADRNLVIGMLPRHLVCRTTHALGLCALLAGRYDEARDLLLDAVAHHRALRAPSLLGRSLLALAEAEVGRHDGTAALAAAREAASLLTGLPNPAPAQRARALQDALGGEWTHGGEAVAVPATTTFVFTDIVSSTAQAAAVGDEVWLALLDAHTSAVRALAAEHGGRVVKGLGDGFFVTFPSAAAGTRFALAARASTAGSGLSIRAGVHTGEATLVDGDHLGHDVNLAARVSGAAGADEVVVSGVVASLLTGSREFELGPGRVVELKGIPGEQVVHLVHAPRREAP